MLTLKQIQTRWNDLVPTARAQGIQVEPWLRLPPTRDRGLLRLNWLLAQLGLEQVEAPTVSVEADAGATMPLRAIMAEWNAMIPQARERGLRVTEWQGLPPTARRGMQRLAWLRAQLGRTTIPVQVIAATAVPGLEAFAGLTFGVEMECIMPFGLTQADLANAVTAAGVPMRPEIYNHSVPSGFWKIVTDGSLRDYTHGIEIVSPPLPATSQGFATLKTVCDILIAKRIKIRKTCGLHCHVGIARESVSTMRNVLKLYSHYERTIDSFLAPSRHHNGFAMSSPVSYWADMDRANSIDDLVRAYRQDVGRANYRSSRRYRKANMQSWYHHQTIEFRQHQGSVDYDKVMQWAKFCLRLVVAGRNEFQAGDQTFDAMVAQVGLATDEATFFRRRAAEFARYQQARLRRAYAA